MRQKIYSIDFLKLYGAIAIALSHFSVNINGSAYCVELFFVISGFFLANKFFSSSNPISAINYTIKHAEKMFPHYIFSLIVLLSYNILGSIHDAGANIKDIVLIIYDRIPETLFLQNIGITNGGINYPLWYVSSLLIAGYFLWQLLLINKNVTVKIICPMLVLLVYTYMYGTSVDIFGWYGIFYLPLWRAFAAISLGILTYTAAKTNWYESNKNKLWFYIIGILAFVFMLFFPKRNNIQLVIIPIIILFLYNEASFINKIFSFKIFAFWGELSYAIYLNHALVIKLVARCLPNISHQKIIYLIILIIYSVITMCLVKFMMRGIVSLKAFLKKEKSKV